MDDTGSQHQQQMQQLERRSVAKEQWRNFLEALEEAEEASAVSGQGGEIDNDAIDNKTIVTTVTTGGDASTIAGTIVELANINQDLEDTAGNLADLEIEFEEDLQCLQMGFESAFNNSFNTLNSSFNTLLNTTNNNIDSSDHNAEGGDELGPFSTRSYQTTASAAIGDIGTSIRSIRHHARGLDSIKKDMENTLRQTLQEQRATGRRMSMGSVAIEEIDDGIMELEPEMEKKFQNWFGRVWKHIEELLEKRRQERQKRMAAQQQQNQNQQEQQQFTNDNSDNSNNNNNNMNNMNNSSRSSNGGTPNANIPHYQPQKKAAGMGLFHVKAVPNNPDMIEVNGSLYTHQEFKRLLRDLNNQM